MQILTEMLAQILDHDLTPVVVAGAFIVSVAVLTRKQRKADRRGGQR